jgi:hypothetical protein
VPTVIRRLFNTVGPRPTGRYGMVVPRFVRPALAGGSRSPSTGTGRHAAASATSGTPCTPWRTS